MSGGVIAALAAVACAGTRRATLTIPAMILLNAPWWVPAVLHPTGGLSTSDAVAAFAPRTESWGTPVTSLLGLGGIWSSTVTPTSRTNPLIPILTIAIIALALLGLRELAKRWGLPATRAVLLLGVSGVTLAALTTLPIGADLMRWLTVNVPGAGLLRDAHRWVAWWAIPLTLGFAMAVEKATAYLPRRSLLAAAALFPIVIMPDLAWAGLGRLDTVDYPDDWTHVRTQLETDPRPGDVLTLPLSAFRQFDWNDRRPQLDPAPRFLPRPTVIDDTLLVNGRPLPGEDDRAAQVRETLARQGDLTTLSIGWLLVEHGTPGRADLPAGLTETYRGPWLSLYRLPGDVRPHQSAGPPRAAVLAADVAALALAGLALLWRVLPAGKLSRVKRNEARE